MADKITTLKEEITGNDVYPNVKEENIPDTIQRKLTSGDGINIENNQVSLGVIQDKNIPDSTNKEVAFNNGIKTNKVTDLNGYKVVEDDNSHINLGNTSRLLQMYGSGSRPTYGGKDLAFYTDTQETQWDLLWANLGIGRWANQTFDRYIWDSSYRKIYDPLLPYYTDYTRMFQLWDYTGSQPITFANDTRDDVNMNFWFLSSKATGIIYLPNHKETRNTSYGQYFRRAFYGSKFSKILIQDGKEFYLSGELNTTFATCDNLTEIGAFDVSLVRQFTMWIGGSSKIKSIHCKHFKVKFSIDDSTAFEESDLVEILNNLDVVSTTQTLTMGATNLAKLTTDDILIATGKGWQLA